MPADDTSKFLDAITRMPSMRRSLAADPIGALGTLARNIGIKPENVDLTVVDLMVSLTDDELRLVGDLRSRIPADVAKGHDGAIIF